MSEKKKTILLADDDPDMIFLVKHHLESWGYEVAAERGISFDINSPGSRSWIKADHYLEKGFRMEQLRLLVKKYLD